MRIPVVTLGSTFIVMVLVVIIHDAAAHAQDDPFGMQSFVVSPSPDYWDQDPTRSDAHNVTASFDDSRGVIPEISVSLVPNDPETVFSVNGIVGSSGIPIAIPWPIHQPWLDIAIIMTAPGGSEQNLSIVLVNHSDVGARIPYITVEPVFGIINASGFVPGSLAIMTVRKSSDGSALATTAPQQVSENGTANWQLSEVGIPLALQPGMEISVSAGELTGSTVVSPLTVDQVDFDNDVVQGSGSPGAGIELFVFPAVGESNENPDAFIEPQVFGHTDAYIGEEGEFDPQFEVDSSGHWSVDLSQFGVDLDENINFDVQSSTNRSPNYGDPEQRPNLQNVTLGATQVYWPPDVPQPGVVIILGIDFVSLEGIAADTRATLVVRDEPDGNVLYTDTIAASVLDEAIWTSPDLLVDLLPGMLVSVSWGDSEIVNTLPNLEVLRVDATSDFIQGFAPANQTIGLGVGDLVEGAGGGQVLDLTALKASILVDQNGNWSYDFTDEFDIQPGMLAVIFFESENGAFGAAGMAEIVPVVEEANTQSTEVSTTGRTIISTESISGSTVEVEVPIGVMPVGTKIEIASIVNENELVEQVRPPDGTDIVLGFRVDAIAQDGSVIEGGFEQPVDLKFVIAPEDITSRDIEPTELNIAFWNGVGWIAISGVASTELADGSILLEVGIDHFTVLAIVHDPLDLVASGSPDPMDNVPVSNFLKDSGIELAPIEEESDGATLNLIGSETFRMWIAGFVGLIVVTSLSIFAIKRRKRTLAGSN